MTVYTETKIFRVYMLVEYCSGKKKEKGGLEKETPQGLGEKYDFHKNVFSNSQNF